MNWEAEISYTCSLTAFVMDQTIILNIQNEVTLFDSHQNVAITVLLCI